MKRQQEESQGGTKVTHEAASRAVREVGSIQSDRSVKTLLLTMLILGWVLFVNIVFYVQLWKEYGQEVMDLLQRLFGG